MSKTYGSAIAFTLVLLAASVTAYAAGPTVEYLGFDPATFTYTYEVTQGYDTEYGLGEFEVDAYTTAAEPYTMADPVENISFGTWQKAQVTWDPVWVGYKWISPGIPPGPVLEYYSYPPWVGTFSLSVPDTDPVPGTLIVRPTEYGVDPYLYDSTVPGHVIPEPTGLLSLAVTLGGLLPALRRLAR